MANEGRNAGRHDLKERMGGGAQDDGERRGEEVVREKGGKIRLTLGDSPGRG